ncbi:uncharacterized protein F54H12.2-like [Brevipalpus obovatus]|uniref:uncharacterized protein F54H12.2-like n=1 Tax=Brevipalpus obovatus TaxID=246614 RepID=UPI003D9F79CB
MEYIHERSIPASKSEVEIFSVPSTQTILDSYYEESFRPTSTLDSTKTYEIVIPPSDDFTDLSETMIHIKCSILDGSGKLKKDETVVPVNGFSASLFEQVDFMLNGVNVSQANNLHHYQSFLEELLYRHPNSCDEAGMWCDDSKRKWRIGKQFDMFFRLHNPLTQQDRLMINGVPIVLRLTKSPDGFGLIKDNSQPNEKYSLRIDDLNVHVKRVRINTEGLVAITSALDKSPACYFLTRSETKSYIIPSGTSYYPIESIFNGILPRRVIVGFVDDSSFKGSLKSSPYRFKNLSITNITLNVSGTQVPSIAYTPDFDANQFSREFYGLFKYLNQNEGVPQLKIDMQEYKDGKTLFAFDLSPDTTLGAESGTLSLIKRRDARVEVRFKNSLDVAVHMIVFAQYDNLLQIDKYRNIMIDY